MRKSGLNDLISRLHENGTLPASECSCSERISSYGGDLFADADPGVVANIMSAVDPQKLSWSAVRALMDNRFFPHAPPPLHALFVKVIEEEEELEREDGSGEVSARTIHGCSARCAKIMAKAKSGTVN